MATLYLLTVNLAGLALTVWGIVRSGDRPQVLLYAFILDYCLRLATISVATMAAQEEGPSWLKALVPLVTSRPARGQQSYPLAEESTKKPIEPWGYLIVVAMLGALAFVLANVNADHELDLDGATFTRDMGWAIRLAVVYWLQSLLAGTTVIDPAAPREINFGYNTREVTILAFATLTAGMVVVVRQSRGLAASGWVLLGPLLAFRFIYDLSAGLQLAKARSRATVGASAGGASSPRTGPSPPR